MNETKIKLQAWAGMLQVVVTACLIPFCFVLLNDVRAATVAIAKIQDKAYVTQEAANYLKASIEARVDTVMAQLNQYMAVSGERQIRYSEEVTEVRKALDKIEGVLSRAVLVQPGRQANHEFPPPLKSTTP